MWFSLIRLVEKEGQIENVNFKGFIVNSAQANFNVVRRTFGYGDLIIPMVGRKCTCLMHWMKFVEMHIRHLIKLDLRKSIKGFVINIKNEKLRRKCKKCILPFKHGGI
jgi:hypothetical protein